MTSRLNPYIAFRNQAREAIEFYHAVFGGELVINSYKDSGMSSGPEQDNKVMHGMLTAENGMIIMVSDTPDHMNYIPGTNISISLSGDNEAELRGYWDKLVEGGTIQEPLVQAPWGDTFGMLTDKFGIAWMVNISGKHA